MDLGTLNGRSRTTATAEAAIEAVRPVIVGDFYDGVTFVIKEAWVRMGRQYWEVPIVPSHFPEHYSPLFEDLADMEQGLRDNDVWDVIIRLLDP